jgi:hypothetical protein
MILTLDALVERLSKDANPNDALPTDALWVQFSEQQTAQTVEYRTKDENCILHVYLDDKGALVGIEMFP